MAKYRVVGSYEEFFEATIEAPNENMAIEIFRQNVGDEHVQEGVWTDTHIESNLQNNEDIEFTMEDYKE